MNNIFTKAMLVKIALSFGRAFLGAFIAGIAGISVVPDFSAAKALAVAAIIAGVTAGIRAVQHLFFDSDVVVGVNR